MTWSTEKVLLVKQFEVKLGNKIFVLNNLFYILPLFWHVNSVLIACSFLTFVGYLKLLSK